jgi:hypothetical protein
MKGYPFEIRCYPLRYDRSARMWLQADHTGHPVDIGVIDRATPETRDVIRRALDRLADRTPDHEPTRYLVLWHRTPRGPNARMFRHMYRDTRA